MRSTAYIGRIFMVSTHIPQQELRARINRYSMHVFATFVRSVYVKRACKERVKDV